jgi:hypothetical protein
MGEPLRVEGLDEALARSLSERLAVDFAARAELDAVESCFVEVEPGGLPLGELLHRLEEWATASGLQSIRVNLGGHAYVLEAARPSRKGADEALISAASPAH